jgi:hypothetical protein
MKSIKSILFAFAVICFIASCEKRDYDSGGLDAFAHHYYAAYLPNTNTGVSVNRNQTALIKFPVQFYSAYTRDYDAVAYYGVFTKNITNPAVLGQDFQIVDKNGATLTPVDGKYSIIFPKAMRAVDTIYVKLLNSSVTGTRKMEVQLVENVNDKYRVDTFSTAFNRPVEIK